MVRLNSEWGSELLASHAMATAVRFSYGHLQRTLAVLGSPDLASSNTQIGPCSVCVAICLTQRHAMRTAVNVCFGHSHLAMMSAAC
mmetsp:Transcript_58561/g.96673  ORF Transcript_58561/g.96673 Transcript_58561/m.96673 type:complete len:86 (-) Transcript_58561:573-830(-)